eukprot:s320_g5.t1
MILAFCRHQTAGFNALRIQALTMSYRWLESCMERSQLSPVWRLTLGATYFTTCFDGLCCSQHFVLIFLASRPKCARKKAWRNSPTYFAYFKCLNHHETN